MLAYESDLLEYDDLFDGSKVVEAQGRRARARRPRPSCSGCSTAAASFAMIDEMKGRLVQSHAERVRRIESGELTVVGVNAFTETEPSPLADERDSAAASSTIDPAVEREQIDATRGVARGARRRRGRRRARRRCARSRATTENLVPATIALARAGGTVGEWAGALREVFGEYRAPDRRRRRRAPRRRRRCRRCASRVQARADATRRPDPASSSASPGSTATPTAPSRSRSRPATPGMEVVYQGIRLTPGADRGRGPRRGRRRGRPLDPVGLAPRAGARDAARCSARTGVDAPVVVGGIIPEADQPELLAAGVARVYTPKDFRRRREIVAELADARRPDKRLRPADERTDGRDGLPRRRACAPRSRVVAVVVGVAAVRRRRGGARCSSPAVVGVAAAGVGALVDVRRAPRRGLAAGEARAQTRRAPPRARLPPGRGRRGADRWRRHRAGPIDLPPGTDTDEWEIDPVSGLLRERHFPVLVQQLVAAARRKVQPVSVVFWSSTASTAPTASRDEQALSALGAVVWRTLRESDAVCRLGDSSRSAVLVDTAEPGALMVAERVRGTLRASPVGDSLTVSAGIACYPTHALDAAELVATRRPRARRTRARRPRARPRRDRATSRALGGLSGVERGDLVGVLRRDAAALELHRRREHLGVGQPLVAEHA